jgi:aminoglycoside phosphotransferase (APT) family kinase protein
MIEEPASVVLLHTDLKRANLLLRGKVLVGVLDWENALLGDPLLELALVGVEPGFGTKVSGLAGACGYAWEDVRTSVSTYQAIWSLGRAAFFRKRNRPHVGWIRRAAVRLR